MPSSASSLEKEFQVQGQACRVADLESTVAVIVTHPWGPLGGNLHNNVVVAAVLYFQRLGLTTCRFDFCGTQIGRGYAQVDQLKQVTEKLLNGDFCNAGTPPPKSIIMVGYSYGSLITIPASAEFPQCIASIAISPPFGVQMWLLLFANHNHLSAAAEANPDLPRLFILGDKDNFTSEKSLRSTVDQYFSHQSATAAVVQGADHFWVRRERDALGVVGQWLASALPQCQGKLTLLRDLEFGLSTSKKYATKFGAVPGLATQQEGMDTTPSS